MMKIDIMTLFPEMIDFVMKQSIIGRAQEKLAVNINVINIRDFTFDKYRKVDDHPYGGGRGMIMMAEPLYLCHKHLCGDEKVYTIMMSAQGKRFTQRKARELLEKKHIIIVCGHYEGIDQRFIETCVDEEISIGDFVMTGGEIPAMAVTDAICRMAPDVLPDKIVFEDESHWNGLLEYPHYTRPSKWRGKEVPSILLSGHHENILKWRRKMSIKRTIKDRPDMFKVFKPQDKNDERFILEIEKEQKK